MFDLVWDGLERRLDRGFAFERKLNGGGTEVLGPNGGCMEVEWRLNGG